MRTNVAARPREVNAEGTPVKVLTPEQELRRTVLACLLWEDGFYEDGQSVADRIKALVPKVGFAKTAALAVEARNAQKLRHVPLLLARECARMSAGRPMGDLLSDIIQRPDELTEFLSLYWKDGKTPIAKQVQHGLARAFRRFSEYQLAKYNRDSSIKLRDVLFLSHAKPIDEAQADLWKRLVDGKLVTPDTWEVALSSGADKREAWTRLLSENKLGALALLRNLRNMIEAKVDAKLIKSGIEAMDVRRVLPFRFIGAARYAPQFEPVLEAAMGRAVFGRTLLPGRTAIVVDTSPSMWMANVSAKSAMTRFDAAAALAILCRAVCAEVAVYAFNHQGHRVPARSGFALRDALQATKGQASCGGAAVAMANEDGYDRIVVLTDGQWHPFNPKTGQLVQNAGWVSEQQAQVISPAPLTDKAYMINVSTQRNGVGYGKWTSIDGWSESVMAYIAASEGAGASIASSLVSEDDSGA